MKRILFLFLPILVVYQALGQSPSLPVPAAGIKYQLNYTVEETSFHKMAAGTSVTSLSPIDMVYLQQHKTVEQTQTLIEDDGDHSTTVTALNPQEAYSEWPTKIGRVEINAAGVQIYQPNGSLYSNLPADSAKQVQYAEMKQHFAANTPHIMYAFPSAPTAVEITDIQANGGTVLMMAQGAWQISAAGISTLWQPALNRITRTTYAGDAVVEKDTRQYAMNSHGVLAPQVELLEIPVTRPSGACMQQVIRKQYSNYQVALALSERSSRASQGGTATYLAPNPATDETVVRLGAEVRAGSALRVTDLTGRTVFEQHGVQPMTEHRISLAGLPAGFYLLRLETNDGLMVLKFAKKGQ